MVEQKLLRTLKALLTAGVQDLSNHSTTEDEAKLLQAKLVAEENELEEHIDSLCYSISRI